MLSLFSRFSNSLYPLCLLYLQQNFLPIYFNTKKKRKKKLTPNLPFIV
ncbi:hypothetical protein BMWSH_2350 [Priestia megaterium WSH-002]|uniref:Uncharacterized protein n=1 Tax=Priestia megaterium (strain WSH-002) TaxID=1006007 RepID=A0A8D3WZY5_PRIMW|nr:hypothetical protein BMWSH_2350 [Priestia megaterium WSH-002]